MSVRTHAPDCAKTLALNAGDSPHPVVCTCGAQYQPGVEAQRDEARREAEKWRNGCLLEFGFVGEAAKREAPLPWEQLDE